MSIDNSKPELVHQPTKHKLRTQRRYLQSRDLDMLESLAIAGCLSVQALEWLHYPAWRTQYAKYLATATPDGPAYKPAGNVHSRLRSLIEQQLLMRMTIPAPNRAVYYERIQPVYGLTEQGAELLYTKRAIGQAPLMQLSATFPDSVDVEALITYGRFYAAIRTAIEATQVPIGQWSYTPMHHDNDGTTSRMPQNAQFFIGQQPYIVDMDTGDTPMLWWHEKISRLTAAPASADASHPAGTPIILIVTPSQRRAARIALEIATVYPTALASVAFALRQHVHPLYIYQAWTRCTQTTQQRQPHDEPTETITMTVYPSLFGTNVNKGMSIHEHLLR